MPILRAILQLTRLGTSLLGFAAIFLPLFVRTGDFQTSFGKASPLLFTCVCTFIANDLDDIERDRVNHPERPLPTGQLAPAVAGIMYFASLGLALFSTRHYVTQGIAFWYYGLIAISISYGYVVECFPSFKAPYVAAVSSIPVLIVAAWYPAEARLYFVAGSVFLVSVCTEALGLLLLLIQVDKPRDIVVLIGPMAVLAIAAIYWFYLANYNRAGFLMKLQLVVGLYFLM